MTVPNATRPRRRRFRDLLLTTHLVVGVSASPFLAVVGVTGALLELEGPASDRANAPLTHVTAHGAALPLDTIVARAVATHPGATPRDIFVGARPDRAYQVDLAVPGARGRAGSLVDPYSGRVIAPLSALRAPLQRVHLLHTRLLLGPAGSAVVATAAAALVFLCATGLWLWWPLKIVRVRGGARRRVLLDLHAALGICSWVFLLVLAVSGMVVHWDDGATTLVSRLAGAGTLAEPPTRAPGCDAPRLGADALVARARAATPGATPTGVFFGPLARVQLRYPEDRTPAGRTNVYLDGCTGRTLDVVSSRTAPLGWRYAHVWNRPLHTGEVLGWPTRVLAALASLTLPLLALTGPLLWLSRRPPNGPT